MIGPFGFVSRKCVLVVAHTIFIGVAAFGWVIDKQVTVVTASIAIAVHPLGCIQGKRIEPIDDTVLVGVSVALIGSCGRFFLIGELIIIDVRVFCIVAPVFVQIIDVYAKNAEGACVDLVSKAIVVIISVHAVGAAIAVMIVASIAERARVDGIVVSVAIRVTLDC